jgi:vacuolar-type H+-ATPase subunit C/Vma6
MPAVQISLDALKISLRLKGSNISEYARSKINPQGQQITRTAIYKAIEEGGPQWLIDEIRSEIAESKKKHPEYWKKVKT